MSKVYLTSRETVVLDELKHWLDRAEESARLLSMLFAEDTKTNPEAEEWDMVFASVECALVKERRRVEEVLKELGMRNEE